MAREKRVRISLEETKRAAVEEAWGVALMTKQKGLGFVGWLRRWRGRRNIQDVVRRHDFGQTIILPSGHT
ncbi:hypothetical protein SDC9_206421 [bioreactor metagenome]|uniref:Uncharacterized protein n=1 Tax=bioreactor metagenome TaxID=1076179 RepID=A0A645J7P0_9ZZZZ